MDFDTIGGITMKFCTKCGAQIHEEAAICTSCGAPVGSRKPKASTVINKNNDVKSATTMAIIALVAAGVLVAYGMFTVMTSILIVGFLGALISLFLGFIKFGIGVVAIIISIIAVIKVTKTAKSVAALPECADKTDLERKMNTAKTLAYIAFAAIVLGIFFLGFIEILFLII